MKRALGFLLALTLVGGFVTACGDDDEKSDSGSDTTEQASDNGGDSGDADTGNSKVDAYCDQVTEYVEEAKKVASDPMSADTAKLQELGQELTTTAQELATELQNNPEEATKLADCQKQFTDAMAG